MTTPAQDLQYDGRLNLRLPAAQLEELRQEAEQNHQTLSERARTLILQGLAAQSEHEDRAIAQGTNALA